MTRKRRGGRNSRVKSLDEFLGLGRKTVGMKKKPSTETLDRVSSTVKSLPNSTALQRKEGEPSRTASLAPSSKPGKPSSISDLLELLVGGEGTGEDKGETREVYEGLERGEAAGREANTSHKSGSRAESYERKSLEPMAVRDTGETVTHSPTVGDSSVDIPKYSGLAVKKPLLAEPGSVGFLMDTYYDGSRGSVVVKLFDQQRKAIILYVDSSGYKPYFYTDIPPDKVRSIPEIASHPGFEDAFVVEKFDALRGVKKRLTKIIVKTPDVVPVLRRRVPRAWEANIKFHLNYIYDHGLIPGLVYRVAGDRLERVEQEIDEEHVAEVLKAFENESEDTKKLALSWLPLFESEPPHIERIAVDIEVYTPFKGRVPSAATASYPVISVAFSSTDGLRAVFVLGREGINSNRMVKEIVKGDYYVELFDDERALVYEALRIISQYPLILSFNGDNFDFPYLYNRALKLGIKREEQPFRFTRDRVSFLYGMHIDLYRFFSIKAIQTYAFGNSYKEFTLDAIASALLGEHKISVDGNISDLPLNELVRYNLRDADLTLRLTTFNNELVWTLIVLLMRISKLPLEDVTRSQVSAWIKSLFYWEHRRRGLLIPDRDEIIQLKGGAKSGAIVKGKKYQGALVIDPPSGIYFDVVVLDFASLYPTIIKNWNLSYETVNPLYCPGEEYVKVPDVGHTVCKSIQGLTSQIVGLLRDYRVKIYKRKAKDKSLPEEWRAWYKTVQAAMKVYINASYGVFGASSFPFYSPPVAESVTAIGRYAIKSALEKSAELGLLVLYGDTDSLFLWNPDSEKLEELIRFFDEEFGLELEVDKVYRFVTFSGLKKNYLGVYREGGVDIKGLVAKKRNTPEFLKKEFRDIVAMVEKIVSAEEFIQVRHDIVAKLREVYQKLKEREYMLDELAIRVALSKAVNEYVKNTPQHVKAAKQLIQVGIEVLPGDVIAFVKTKTSDGVKPVQLARLHEVDIDKYVEYMRSTFEQILRVLNITWDSVTGSRKLEAFFKH